MVTKGPAKGETARFINWIRAKQGRGQPIRDDGPVSHLSKVGTPTMGGLMILAGIGVAVFLWGDLTNPYIWIVSGVTAAFGVLGFIDDYAKVTKQTSAGLTSKQKLLAQTVVAVIAGVGYLALKAPRRPRVAQLAFLLVAGFLLVNKVWSPQYSLWLVPLAVLAIPHTRLLLAWMTIDALVWVPRMMYFLGMQNKGLPEQAFTATVLLRDLAVIGLCVLVVRQIYRPDEDLVRSTYPGPYSPPLDDPAGGVLDGAPDSSWLRSRSAQRGRYQTKTTSSAARPQTPIHTPH